MRNVQQTFSQIIEEVPYLPEELQMAVANLDDPSALSHLIAGALRIGSEERQALLEEVDVGKRLRRLSRSSRRGIVAIGSRIQSQVNAEMEKGQREWVLRQQQAIQDELGEQDPAEAEVDELRLTCRSSSCPTRSARRSTASSAGSRRSRRRRPSTASSAPTSSGWRRCRGTRAPRTTSTSRTREVLDADHYDIEKVKDRILEFLAVRSQAGPRGSILCFAGPPGRQDLARPVDRPRARSQVRAHQRRRRARRVRDPRPPPHLHRGHARHDHPRAADAESHNPVFMIDEIDKMGADYRGDPGERDARGARSGAERDVRDHYLDVPFDLSRVMFICTANDIDRVPVRCATAWR